MSRLIDADALLLALDKRKTYELADGRNRAYGKGVRDAMKDVDRQPTVDAVHVGRCDECKKILLDKNETATFPIADYAPVVHGHWIHSGYACGETDWECSVCHCHEWRTNKTEYCMRCGAKMDESTHSNDSNTLDALGEKVTE